MTVRGGLWRHTSGSRRNSGHPGARGRGAGGRNAAGYLCVTKYTQIIHELFVYMSRYSIRKCDRKTACFRWSGWKAHSQAVALRGRFREKKREYGETSSKDLYILHQKGERFFVVLPILVLFLTMLLIYEESIIYNSYVAPGRGAFTVRSDEWRRS